MDSQPIYGYDKIEINYGGFTWKYYTKWPILSEEVGFKYERKETNKKFGDLSEKVIISDKIFNGADSVIIAIGRWPNGPYYNRITYQEYTKNIGLTKEFLIDTVNMDTLYKKVLIDYHINHMP